MAQSILKVYLRLQDKFKAINWAYYMSNKGFLPELLPCTHLLSKLSVYVCRGVHKNKRRSVDELASLASTSCFRPFFRISYNSHTIFLSNDQGQVGLLWQMDSTMHLKLPLTYVLDCHLKQENGYKHYVSAVRDTFTVRSLSECSRLCHQQR